MLTYVIMKLSCNQFSISPQGNDVRNQQLIYLVLIAMIIFRKKKSN